MNFKVNYPFNLQHLKNAIYIAYYIYTYSYTVYIASLFEQVLCKNMSVYQSKGALLCLGSAHTRDPVCWLMRSPEESVSLLHSGFMATK